MKLDASLMVLVIALLRSPEEGNALVSAPPSITCRRRFAINQSRGNSCNRRPVATSRLASLAADDAEATGASLQMPSDVSIPILYESERVIAINKPHGIPHHDDVDANTPGILTLFRHLQSLDESKKSNAIDYKGRVYGVHRLDRATSGILLLAKDKETAGLLTRQFRRRNVVKYYFAISSKKPKKQKQGWVKGDMAKGRRGAWMLQKSMNDPAITRFFTAGLGALTDSVVEELHQLAADATSGGGGPIPKTAILFRPHTGRTHQLRVAAKATGMPILMDPYYGDGTAPASLLSLSKNVQRTFLHASALHLRLSDGDDDEVAAAEDITIWCPPPFESLWQEEAGAQFHDIVKVLMTKNCESKDILNMM
jgi:tRNA pseudouridine32 synthase/23S rRNA pseudouridine746 synthase